MAIRIAEECGLTLIGFARQGQQAVYTHPHRLTNPSTHFIANCLMNIEKLVKMANGIANFFNAESDKELAAEGVKKHIMRSWDPRMRKEIIKYYREGGPDLQPLSLAAIKKLADSN